MTATVLVDSDILIEVLRNRNLEMLTRWRSFPATVIAAYSPITVAEIWHGAKEKEREAIENVFANLECIPIDQGIGRQAGEYLKRFQSSHGTQIGDALIAATATTHELHLWTRNRKHYPMNEVRFY